MLVAEVAHKVRGFLNLVALEYEARCLAEAAVFLCDAGIPQVPTGFLLPTCEDVIHAGIVRLGAISVTCGCEIRPNKIISAIEGHESGGLWVFMNPVPLCRHWYVVTLW